MALSPVTRVIKTVHWLPVLATALVLFDCHLPGNNQLNTAGLSLWAIYVASCGAKAIGGGKALPSETLINLKKIYIVLLVLGCISVLGLTSYPKRTAFMLARSQLNTFVASRSTGPSLATDETIMLLPKDRNKIGPYSILAYKALPEGKMILVTSLSQNGTVRTGLVFRPKLGNFRFNQQFPVYEMLDEHWGIFQTQTNGLFPD